MATHTKKRGKLDVSTFLITFLPHIFTCLISLLMSFIQIPIVWKVVICIAPWILLCFLVAPCLKKYKLIELRKISDSRNKIMPEQLLKIQKQVESFMSTPNTWTKITYMEIMRDICNNIRNCYIGLGEGTIGYEHFSVSIKEVQGSDENLQIREICRDSSSLSEQRKIPFVHTPYPLERNTPYKSIIDTYMSTKQAKIFVEQDVHAKLRLGKYHCSRFDTVGLDGVPYRSVCVSPVLPLHNPNGSSKILGFICVDAEQTDCFRADDPVNTIFHECVSAIVFKMMAIQNKLK